MSDSHVTEDRPSCHKLLKQALDDRQARNRSYSLRAFARDLSVSPSRLSEIMKGQHLSPRTAQGIADAIFQTEDQKQFFIDLALAEGSPSPLVAAMAQDRVAHYLERKSVHHIQEKDFRSICDWHHFAILELMKTGDFRADLTWMADRLNTSRQKIASALNRLEGLGLIQCSEEGMRLCRPKNETRSDTPSRAIRAYHRQILDKAHQAIRDDAPLDRDLASTTIAIEQRQLPEVKKLIKRLRGEFEREVAALCPHPDEVFCFSSQFFSLTKEAPSGEGQDETR